MMNSYAKKEFASNSEELQKLETAFYVLMQEQTENFQKYLLIADQYEINSDRFDCSVYLSSPDSKEAMVDLFHAVKKRHEESTELYIKSLFKEISEHSLRHPISKINGYLMYKNEKNEIDIYRFAISHPRPRFYTDTKRKTFFRTEEIQEIAPMEDDEIEILDHYFKITITDEPLKYESMFTAKTLAVQVLSLTTSFSDEALHFKHFELIWSNLIKQGETTVSEFESFWFPLIEMGENCSREIREMVEELIEQILSKKSFVNQYQLCKQYEPDSPIFLS